MAIFMVLSRSTEHRWSSPMPRPTSRMRCITHASRSMRLMLRGCLAPRWSGCHSMYPDWWTTGTESSSRSRSLGSAERCRRTGWEMRWSTNWACSRSLGVKMFCGTRRAGVCVAAVAAHVRSTAFDDDLLSRKAEAPWSSRAALAGACGRGFMPTPAPGSRDSGASLSSSRPRIRFSAERRGRPAAHVHARDTLVVQRVRAPRRRWGCRRARPARTAIPCAWP